MKNILFICSRNKWRSLTAETVYKNHPDFNVKSAGTEGSARIRVNVKLIAWADLIFVMEKKHKEKLEQKFSLEINDKKVITLDIPDHYKYMDQELIDEIQTAVSMYI